MPLFDSPIPFTERREAASSGGSSYTDAIVQAIQARAAGTAAADASATAALETAAGLWARALAAARVTPETPATRALTPDTLHAAGREAIRTGAALLAIDVDGLGNVRLLPVWAWDVRGGADPDAWIYRCTLAGPSGTAVRVLPAAAVVHLRFASEPARPWIGVSPMQLAQSTGGLAGNLELRLSQEAGAPVGSVIPVPTDGGSGDDSEADPLADLKADLRASRGGVSLVETAAAGWGEGRAAAPAQDWKQRRFGADPPEALRGLRADVYDAICMACGVPPGLSSRADGTLAREGWRQFIMGSVEPLARVWAGELARKLDAPGLALTFRDLWAHDLAGRAAAFQKLTAGGMDVAKAARQSGVLADDG